MGKLVGTISLGLYICLCQLAAATTWHVDCSVSESGNGQSWETAFQNVQQGINAASPADTVIVRQGTYYENIHFRGKNITLRSTDPLDSDAVASTIIDGSQSGSVVTFSGMEDETCVLSGFTIRNGKADNGAGICGGTQSDHTRATIQNNVVTANWAEYGGGLGFCDGIIENNRIADNSCVHGGGGLRACDATIRHNIICGNSAVSGGGGLYYCHATFHNNTIVGNVSRSGSGGLETCPAKLTNCIIWGNVGPDSPQMDSFSQPKYCCIHNWKKGGVGNMSVSPHFVNHHAGDYHLQSWSPCIDAGNPTSDFSREPQPSGGRVNMGAYGNTPDAASASKDADGDILPDDWEMHFFGDLRQGDSDDTDGDGWSNLDEYHRGTDPARRVIWYVDSSAPASGDGTSWETAFKSIQEGIDAAGEWDTVLVAQGTYVENIQFRGKNIVLRSADALNRTAPASTIIDGSQSGSVVTFAGTEDRTCVLSGFTLRNGKAANGAGICGGTFRNRTYATVENNVISANSGAGLVYCYGPICNNTIAGNEGGLYGCQGTIRNCIVWENQGFSQVSGCHVPAYSCIQSWTGGGSTNISYYPHFVDAPNGDYHLRSWSPCIDAGSPTSPFSEEPQPNGGRINMGAYGNTRDATPKSPDTDGDGLPDAWEMESFGSLAQGSTDDPDGDLIPNIEEYYRGFNPTIPLALWHVSASAPTSGDGTSWQTAFKSIQEGIDAAGEWDTVLVAQGTYVENILFNGTNIVLRSTNPDDPDVVASTVIDGNQAGSVVTFNGAEEETCVLSGFTIRNGKAEHGGVICGGVKSGHTHATIENNVIAGNLGQRWPSGYGGGLAFCDGVIENNTISDNSAGSGGGLYDCDGTIRNNMITGNRATADSGCGGGLHRCDGTIENNTICGNSANYYGGGLYSCDGTIRNCIIWGNPLSDCSTPSYSCIERWRRGGQGNIAYYPYFVDAPNGDYHLKSWSPCIDAGGRSSDFSNEPQPNGGRINMGAYGNTGEAASKSPDTDSDGLPDDWEMEFFANLSQEASDDPDGDLISNIAEWYWDLNPAVLAVSWVDASVPFSGDGTSWETAFKTVREGIAAASDADMVIVAPGTYPENIQFNGKSIVLRSTDPLDSNVVASTVIDGNQAASVVTFSGMERETCVLAGFTIRNGAARDGAGICGGTWYNRTHATIQNNTITGNSATVGGGGLAYCRGVIRNSIINDNSADYGGGLYRCDGEILDDTIYGNSADDAGGGLLACDGTITNSIIWANLAPSGPQLSECSQPTYSCIENWEQGGLGNISTYPDFADPHGGDYHLHNWSHCIDTGDPSSDFSNEPQPNGARINIGAYGNTPEAASAPEDTDEDLLSDEWEMRFFGNLAQGTFGDPDRDGWSNFQEYRQGTNPTLFGMCYVDGAVPLSGDGTSWETPFRTIQEGIDGISRGAIVLVAEGIYVENIAFRNKTITLTGIDPLNPTVVANTIIDGKQCGPVVTFHGFETEASVLSGFTIRNGRAPNGGGICGNGTHAKIRNNVIAGNSADGNGGGLHDCAGIVRNCVITANSANYGGGLYGCHGEIENNTISENSARYGGGLARCDGAIQHNTISGNSADMYGGGIARCHGLILSNTITGNSADMYGGGLYGCDGIIQSNTITANSSGYRGGGLDNCLATIQNNIIAGNWATWNGGGLYACDGTILNNTIVANSAGYCGGGLDFGCGTIHNCIIWANRASRGPQLYDSSEPTYSCIQDSTGGGDGNIAEDPEFADAENGDFRLSPSSPCIDVGRNDPDVPDTDITGMHRIMYGGKSLTVDMGAYEYYINDIKLDANTDITLTWSSLSGRAYAIYSSRDMMTWELAAGSVSSSGDTVTTWLDPTAPLLSPDATERYYKVQECE